MAPGWAKTFMKFRCQEKISWFTIVSCTPKSLMKCALIVTLKVSKQSWNSSRVYCQEFVWRVREYFVRWWRQPHACVLDDFPWHDRSVTWLCGIHSCWQLGTSSGCFWTYTCMVSCLWPPKLLSPFSLPLI